MKEAEKLTDLMDRFQEYESKRMPYDVYCELSDMIVDAVYDVSEANPDYGLEDHEKVLKEYGLEWDQEVLRDADVSERDERCITAMLMGMVLAEDFCEDIIWEFIEDGIVLRWLKRLKDITGQASDIR